MKTKAGSHLLIGLEKSQARSSLAPLLKAIELEMLDAETPKDTLTLFSCDSFCEPHLEHQLKMLEALKRVSNSRVCFFNFPASHYVTSVPDPELLRLASNPVMLWNINEQIILRQLERNMFISDNNLAPRCCEETVRISEAYHELACNIRPSCWENIYIFGTPFHELAYRDLCLTYKCNIEAMRNPSSDYYNLYLNASRVNLYLLLLLILNSRNMGSLCLQMSLYNPSLVFMFFCGQTNRELRFFHPPQDIVAVAYPELSNASCINLGPKALPICATQFYRDQVLNLKISDRTRKIFRSFINKRLEGGQSHVYSKGTEFESKHKGELEAWIHSRKKRNRIVIAAFSSSDDEKETLNLIYRHAGANIAHLNPSLYTSQLQWLSELIVFSRSLSNNVSLVIRIHPRLAADHRGLPASPALEELIEGLYRHSADCAEIRIIEPHIDISSYWLGMQSDLILSAWSFISLEFALLGKRVMSNSIRTIETCGMTLHAKTPPLRCRDEYISRLRNVISAISANREFDSDMFISIGDAEAQMVQLLFGGLVDLDSDQQLMPQIINPQTINALSMGLL